MSSQRPEGQRPEGPADAVREGPRAPTSGLVLVSTPIGNLGDITSRALATLAAADLVLCEDTRTTARLFAAHGIQARTAALHEHNEDARIAGTLALLREGKLVAVVSDAGTPLVSDPNTGLTARRSYPSSEMPSMRPRV